MIRWRFVLTRLIILVTVIVLLRCGLGPVARYVTIGGLESATGAKVEIADARVGLFPPQIRFVDLAIADPRDGKQMRDALRAKSIDLAIDGDALLHRRWVASDGRITGLEIGSRRTTSGHHSDVVEQEPASASDSPSVLSQLLGAATYQISRQSQEMVDGLETVRRSRQIRAHWESEYESLVVRARDLEKRIRAVRDEARGVDNPLRDLPRLERTLAQARQARNELTTVRETIDSLPGRLEADLATLDQAKQIDLAKVDALVPGDLAGANDFGVELLTEAVRAQVQRIRGYLDNGRELANYTVVAPESVRGRGFDHDLRRTSLPSLLIRRCEINGSMRSGGEQYTMTGILENLTPTPELLEEPTRARLRLDGAEVVRVEYVRDRRKGSDVDLLTLHWPQSEAKPLRLGNDHDAGIAIEGGQRELWVQVKTEGERLKGRLVSKQTGLQMALSVDPKYADTIAARSLKSSLAAVDRIEIDANFEGTWRDIDLRLSSNLSQILRRATEKAIDGQLQVSRERLAAKVEEAHAEQVAVLRQWLGTRQGEARSLLASADKSIEEMSQKLLAEVGDADAYLGKLRSAIRGRLK